MANEGTGMLAYFFVLVIMVLKLWDPSNSRIFPTRPSDVDSHV